MNSFIFTTCFILIVIVLDEIDSGDGDGDDDFVDAPTNDGPISCAFCGIGQRDGTREIQPICYVRRSPKFYVYLNSNHSRLHRYN